MFFFFFFSHKERQPLKQERFYLAILASRLLHLSCLLHWICQNVTVSNKQKNMRETFNKVALNKPPRVNVYEQFHPVKIIKAHLIPPKNMPQVTIL